MANRGSSLSHESRCVAVEWYLNVWAVGEIGRLQTLWFTSGLRCHVEYHNNYGTGRQRNANAVTTVAKYKTLSCLLRVVFSTIVYSSRAVKCSVSHTHTGYHHHVWVRWRGMNYVTADTSTAPHLLPQQQQQQQIARERRRSLHLFLPPPSADKPLHRILIPSSHPSVHRLLF